MTHDEDALQDFGRKAGAALRGSEALDAVTSARLAAARARALGAAGGGRSRWPLALGGALAACLLAVLLIPAQVPSRPPPVAAESAARDALELLADEQDPQFYQDLDLYLWLEAGDGHA